MRYFEITLFILIASAIIGVVVFNSMGQNTSISYAQKTMPMAGEPTMDTSSLFNASMSVPELTGITAWLNTNHPITLQSLKGKVVLVDFWTNQCINCIHTLPYVTKWYDTYKDSGFVVIGVHTPELAYERTVSSIQTAIQNYAIHYPIAQDNNYATWNAFNNQYWPAEYLVNKKGVIVRTYFGEGEYDKTELAIQTLLKE